MDLITKIGKCCRITLMGIDDGKDRTHRPERSAYLDTIYKHGRRPLNEDKGIPGECEWIFDLDRPVFDTELREKLKQDAMVAKPVWPEGWEEIVVTPIYSPNCLTKEDGVYLKVKVGEIAIGHDPNNGDMRLLVGDWEKGDTSLPLLDEESRNIASGLMDLRETGAANSLNGKQQIREEVLKIPGIRRLTNLMSDGLSASEAALKVVQELAKKDSEGVRFKIVPSTENRARPSSG